MRFKVGSREQLELDAFQAAMGGSAQQGSLQVSQLDQAACFQMVATGIVLLNAATIRSVTSLEAQDAREVCAFIQEARMS